MTKKQSEYIEFTSICQTVTYLPTIIGLRLKMAAYETQSTLTMPCHPKNKLFSPDIAALPSLRIQKMPIPSGIDRVFLLSAKKILTLAEIY